MALKPVSQESRTDATPAAHTPELLRTAAEWDAFYGREPSPGPWRVLEHPKQGVHVMFDPRPTTSISICRVYIVEGASQRPNARLIAAAPDLLAALKAMLDPNECTRDVDLAIAALHKAEGRS